MKPELERILEKFLKNRNCQAEKTITKQVGTGTNKGDYQEATYRRNYVLWEDEISSLAERIYALRDKEVEFHHFEHNETCPFCKKWITSFIERAEKAEKERDEAKAELGLARKNVFDEVDMMLSGIPDCLHEQKRYDCNVCMIFRNYGRIKTTSLSASSEARQTDQKRIAELETELEAIKNNDVKAAYEGGLRDGRKQGMETNQKRIAELEDFVSIVVNNPPSTNEGYIQMRDLKEKAKKALEGKRVKEKGDIPFPLFLKGTGNFIFRKKSERTDQKVKK